MLDAALFCQTYESVVIARPACLTPTVYIFGILATSGTCYVYLDSLVSVVDSLIVFFVFVFYEWENRTGTMCPFSSLHPSRKGEERQRKE